MVASTTCHERIQYRLSSLPLCALALQIALHRYFDWTMLALILISSIQLCLDSPAINPDGKLAMALHIMDYIFVVAFGVEMLMKVSMQCSRHQVEHLHPYSYE